MPHMKASASRPADRFANEPGDGTKITKILQTTFSTASPPENDARIRQQGNDQLRVTIDNACASATIQLSSRRIHPPALSTLSVTPPLLQSAIPIYHHYQFRRRVNDRLATLKQQQQQKVQLKYTIQVLIALTCRST